MSIAAADAVGHVALNNHFTEFRVGRLVVPKHLITSDTQALFIADCAKKCMVLSAQKCMSFNFHSTGHCEILEAIEGHDHELAVVSVCVCVCICVCVCRGVGQVCVCVEGDVCVCGEVAQMRV